MSKIDWKRIALPFIFLLVFLSLYMVWKALNLPPESELIEIARGYFEKYGIITVLVSSIIEGMLLVGWYYPGSLVIFLGVIFAGKDVLQVIFVVSFVTLGLSIGYIINFFLGKYGWYRLLLAFGLKKPLNDAQKRLTKYGLSGIFVSYWQPNLAAVTSTAAGILRFPFRKFLLFSSFAVILWNVFWGTLVYFMGETALSIVGLKFVFVSILIWILYSVIVSKFKKPFQEFRDDSRLNKKGMGK